MDVLAPRREIEDGAPRKSISDPNAAEADGYEALHRPRADLWASGYYILGSPAYTRC